MRTIYCYHYYVLLFLEYQTFARRYLTGMQVFNKPVSFKAFEHLISLELIKSTESISQNTHAKEFKPMCMLVKSSQIQETLQQYPDCPTELKNWCESMFA